MAFEDPIIITVNGSAKSMPRVGSGPFKADYQTQDENWIVNISHQKIAGNVKLRSLFRFRQRKIASDPLGAGDDYAFNDWLWINERPIVGFSATEVFDQLAGLKTYMDATKGGKFFGQES